MLHDIYEAVHCGDVNCVLNFINNKDNAHLLLPNPKKRNGDTLLHIAARNGNAELLRILLQVINVEVQNNDGKHPLHEAAASSADDCITILLQHAADVNALKRADWTPLMFACTKSSLTTIKLLLSSGASMLFANKDGWTSFHIACREGHEDIIDYLLQAYPRCWKTASNNGRTPLHTVALHGHTAVLRLLLSVWDDDINSQDSCGSTALMDALRKGHIEIAKILLSHGASLYICDAIGRLPIHVISECGELSSLAFLLSKGVDINSGTLRDGQTALHLAAKEGHPEMIRALLENGACVELMDKHNRTALMVAQACRKDSCVKLLAVRECTDASPTTGDTGQLSSKTLSCGCVNKHLTRDTT